MFSHFQGSTQSLGHLACRNIILRRIAQQKSASVIPTQLRRPLLDRWKKDVWSSDIVYHVSGNRCIATPSRTGSVQAHLTFYLVSDQRFDFLSLSSLFLDSTHAVTLNCLEISTISPSFTINTSISTRTSISHEPALQLSKAGSPPIFDNAHISENPSHRCLRLHRHLPSAILTL